MSSSFTFLDSFYPTADEHYRKTFEKSQICLSKKIFMAKSKQIKFPGNTNFY